MSLSLHQQQPKYSEEFQLRVWRSRSLVFVHRRPQPTPPQATNTHCSQLGRHLDQPGTLSKLSHVSIPNTTVVMAPIPEDIESVLDPQSTSPEKKDDTYWTKPNIAVTAVFALLALVIAIALLVFFLRHRAEKKKTANRKSDRAGLLEHEDKTSMFSRERHSSVTLYVDSEAEAQNKRISQDTLSLVPLHATSVEETPDPLNSNNRTNTDTTITASNGSGISAISRLSSNTASTLMLSPISPSGDDGDLSIRSSGRPRSTSTASQRARYYESTPINTDMPPIPKIVRTISD